MALTDEEFFFDEAEELEILRCRHLREHHANYPIGFLSQFLLFIYVGLTYWSIPPCVLRGVHRWLPLHRLCAFRGVHFRHLSTGVPVCFKEYIVGILFSVPLRNYTLAR